MDTRQNASDEESSPRASVGQGSDGWQRNLAALCVTQALSIVGFSFVFPFMPLYVQTLGITGVAEAAQWAGLIGAASAISTSIVQPFWGNVADKWGRKAMVVRSCAGNAIATAALGLCVSPEQLLVVRVLNGLVTGVMPAATALVATSTPKARLGFALGLMQVSVFVGSSTGPLIGGVATDTLGYRAAFFIAGGITTLGMVIALLFVREDRSRLKRTASRLGLWSSSRSLLASTIFAPLVGIMFMIQFGNLIVTPILSLFVAELSGGENAATLSGILLTATGVASAASALAFSRISDRVGHAVILPVCLLGAAVTYLPQAAVQDVWQLLALRIMLGLFLGGLIPSANSLVAKLVPQDRQGAAFGLTAMAQSAAMATGPLSGAAVATHWGIRSVFLATSASFAMAWAGMVLALRRYRASHTQTADRL